MDEALKLKIELDSGVELSKEEAIERLSQSILVSKLTSELVNTPLYYVWRTIALSEISYAEHLPYTNVLIDKLYANLSTPYGFSLSGDENMFLPCYNAMLVTALCRLGRAKDSEVKIAVDWINANQPMERGVEVVVDNLKFDRYGGCFKHTPCYIGLAKSVIALHTYKKYTGDTGINKKLLNGIEYLLDHRLYKRLSNGQPITERILDISFPASYHLNIVELIRFAAEADLMVDNRVNDAVEYLQNLITKNSGWKLTYRYKANGYLVFDKGRNEGDWVTYIIAKALGMDIQNTSLFKN